MSATREDEKQAVVVLLSGGMDSVTVFYQALKDHQVVGALSFDYGAKHNHREIPFARWHAEQCGVPHTVVDLGFIGGLFNSALLKGGEEIPEGHYADESMRRTVVPFRNGIMLAVATGFAETLGASGVVIAAHAGDHSIYPDCREPFMKGMAEAMHCGTYAKVELLRPFIEMDKTGIARLGQTLGVDYSRTWSCYKGGGKHCGLCGTCVERKEAFALAGMEDPTDYLE